MENRRRERVDHRSFWLGLVVGLVVLGVGLSWAVYGQGALETKLSVSGLVAADGILFPDGTVQTTAAASEAAGSSANQGLYDNRIVDISPSLPYVEVCFKSDGFDFDFHLNGGDSTAGGDCLPGDVGFVMERDERLPAFWEDARLECLEEGMRLPEPFEYLLACRRADDLALLSMTGNHEWASNTARPQISFDFFGVGVPRLGSNSCSHGGWGWVTRSAQADFKHAYRCVR